MTEPNIPLMDDLVLVRNSNSEDWVARRSAEELTSDGLLCWCDGDNSKSKTKIRLAWKHWRPLTRMAIMGIKVKQDPPVPVRAAPANDTLVEVAAANGEWRNRYSSGRIVDDVLLCWSEGKTSKTAVNKHDTTAWKKWRIPQAEESREDDSKENPEKSSPLISDAEWAELFRRDLDRKMGFGCVSFDIKHDYDWGGWIDGGTSTVMRTDARIDVQFANGAIWYNLPAKDIVVTAGMKYRLAVTGRPPHHSV